MLFDQNNLHNIEIRFSFDLNPCQTYVDFGYYGPVFFDWFPEGPLIKEISKDTSIEISLGKKENIPESNIDEKRVIADRINGSIRIRDIETRIHQNIIDDTNLQIKLAKSIVREIIGPIISTLLDILIVKYHQYWIRRFRIWDSQSESIGQFCNRLKMQWRRNNDGDWASFQPEEDIDKNNPLEIATEEFFQQYLTKEDWISISRDLKENKQFSDAARLLACAYKFYDTGDLIMSFIEGIYSLEIALDEAIKLRSKKYSKLIGHIDQFYKMDIKEKLAIYATISYQIDNAAIEEAIKCIEVRNSIVIGSNNPDGNQKKNLIGLFKTISKILDDISIKFPAYPF